VADLSNTRVVEIAPPYTSVASIKAGLSQPTGISIDAADNVFVSDVGTGTAVELLASSNYATSIPLGATAGNPNDIKVDASGNVYVASGDNGLFGFDAQSSPTIAFPATISGATSAALSVPLSNNGNMPLSATNLAVVATSPSTTAPFALPTTATSCNNGSSPFTIAAGASCDINANFTPTGVASYTAQVNIADNSLNNAASVQAVPLTGTGQLGTPVITVSTATATYSDTALTTLTASIAFGSTVPTGAVTFQVDTSATVTATCTGTSTPITCTASYNTSVFTASQHDINVSIAAAGVYDAATELLHLGLTVNPITPTLTLTQPTTITYGSKVNLTATIPFSGSEAPTGAITFTVGTQLVTPTCTVTGPGAGNLLTCTTTFDSSNLNSAIYTVSANYVGDSNYNAITVSKSLTISSFTPVIAVASPSTYLSATTVGLSATVAYSNAVPAGGFTFVINGGTSVTASCAVSGTLTETCTATYNPSALTVNTYTIVGYLAINPTDNNYAPSNSGTTSGNGTLTIFNPLPVITVATPAAIVYGVSNVSLSASVAYQGTTVPSGAFTFRIDSGAVVTATCAGTATPLTCTASYPAATIAAGSHTVTSTVAPGGIYLTASSTSSLTVNQAGTTTELTSSASTINPSQSITLTANVASLTSGTPTGSVTFYDSGTSIGTASLVNGIATFVPPANPASTN
ncbi:MAG: Ig-like domain repeat protein, partial [Bryocella sp.]